MTTRWKEMTGEERYRVVELARSGQTPIKEICETFGVTRQTLNRAIAAAEEAARAALEKRKPGRKGKSAEEKRITELSKQRFSLEKEVEHWKTRYEVMKKFAELAREELEGDKPAKRDQKKRRRKKRRDSSGKLRARREAPVLAAVDDGRGAGDTEGEPAAMDETSGDAEE